MFSLGGFFPLLCLVILHSLSFVDTTVYFVSFPKIMSAFLFLLYVTANFFHLIIVLLFFMFLISKIEKNKKYLRDLFYCQNRS